MEKSTSGADRCPQAAVDWVVRGPSRREKLTQKINLRRTPKVQRGKGYRLSRSRWEGWRTRENILAPEGPSGKEETLGEEAIFEE